MADKDLKFKLVLDADVQNFVQKSKVSKDAILALFNAIQQQSQTQSNQAIEQTSEAIDDLAEAAENAKKSVSGMMPSETQKKVADLVVELDLATNAVKKLGSDADSLSDHFKEVGIESNAALKQMIDDLEQAKLNLNYLQATSAAPKDIEQATKDVEELETGINQVKIALAAYENATRSFDKVADGAEEASDAIDNLGDEAEQTANQIDKLEQSVDSTNKHIEKSANASHDFAGKINGLKTGFGALASAMAVVGIGLGAKEILDTADSYANLSARIKIATKDGGDFAAAMAGVQRVALATNSSLEATADLFTRLNTAGKSMGMTQEQVLDLTQTVNQSIQISGGSAQAAEAAITQFIQAMQSGVLRGEEFNSILENGYGLAETLAKGLGVATGELRKMAGDGELTAERVIKALQSQKDAVQETYNQMPLTVGQALQKIRTQWQILIGEFDQEKGGSAAVAKFLSQFADSLSGLRVVLDDISQGVEWFNGKLQSIDPAVIEALKSALIEAYDAVKIIISALADMGETAIDVLDGAFDVLLPLNNSLSDGTEKASGFQKAINALRLVMSVMADGVMGANIGFKLLAGAVQVVTASVVQLQAKAVGLFNKELGDQLQGTADALFAKGKKNFEDAKKLTQDYQVQSGKVWEDIHKTQQQKNAESVADHKKAMDEILADDEATKEQKIQAVKEYAEAFIKANNGAMDGQKQVDLLAQGYIVTLDKMGKVSVKAWEKTEQGAQTAEQRAEQARKAATALGLDLDVSLNRVSSKFNENKAQLDKFAQGLKDLGVEGQQSSNVLYEAWQKWLEGAKSQAEIDAAKVKLQEFGQEGKISTQQVEMGMIAIKNQVEKLPPSIDPVTEAFKRLGIQTKEQLRNAALTALNDFNTVQASGQASADQIKKAYERMMQAAAASGDNAVISQAKAKAAALGLSVEIDKTGQAVIKSFDDMDNAAEKHASTVSNTVTSAYKEMGQVAREEAQNSIDAWNKALTEKNKQAEAQKNSHVATKSYQAYTLEDVIAQLKSQGFSDEQARRHAGAIWSKARLADRGMVNANRLAGNSWAADSVQRTINSGQTTAFGSNVIEEELRKAAAATDAMKGIVDNVAKHVDESLAINDKAKAIVESANPEPTRNVKINVATDSGYEAEVYADNNNSRLFEEFMRELEMQKKRS